MNQEKYKRMYQALDEAFGDHLKALQMNDDHLTHTLIAAAAPESLESAKEEIRNAILHFYTTKGVKAFVFFKSGKIITRTRILNLEDNFYVDALTTQFNDIFKHATISPDIKGVSFIPEELTIKLLDFLSSLEEVEQKKEIIKAGLKRILDLHGRDALFFMNNKIMIKKFVEAEKKKEGPARRSFDHIPQEALEYTEQEMRKQGLDKKMQDMMQEMFKDELNFRKIDNFYFAKNFIRLLQSKFVTFITPFMNEESEENILAFSNYILRKDFDTLLFHMATELIRLLLEKDSNAENFVKFYNGDTSFAADGKRFQKPDIRDDKGGRWNQSTIFQVAMQRKKGLEKIKEAKGNIQMSEATIKKIEGNISDYQLAIEKKKTLMDDLNVRYHEFNTITKEKKDQIFALKTELNNEKNAERQQSLQAEINQISVDIKRNFKEEEDNLQQKLKVENEIERTEITIKTLHKDKDAHLRKLNNNHTKLEELIKQQEPLEEKFQVVVHALAKTMSSFRGA